MAESMTSAVWTVHYTTPEGYEATLQLAGADVRQVLTTARQVTLDLARLAKAPTPTTAPASPVTTNGNGAHGEPSNGHAIGAEPDWCPVHKCAMQRRGSNGDTWYSHRTADGGWCRGKVAQQ